MCDFKPGDEVVCVNAAKISPAPWMGDIPETGRVYTVASVQMFLGEPHVCLREITNAPFFDLEDTGYRASRFRKVEHRNDSLSIEAFLTIKPGFEEPKRQPAKPKERV